MELLCYMDFSKWNKLSKEESYQVYLDICSCTHQMKEQMSIMEDDLEKQLSLADQQLDELTNEVESSAQEIEELKDKLHASKEEVDDLKQEIFTLNEQLTEQTFAKRIQHGHQYILWWLSSTPFILEKIRTNEYIMDLIYKKQSLPELQNEICK